MALNEIAVAYSDPRAEPATNYRETLSNFPGLFGNMSMGGRCVAYLKFTDGTWMAQMSESSMVAGIGLGYAKHAEQVLIDCYAMEAAGKTVEFVYTELQCCGAGSGMRNCRATMENFLTDHGEHGAATPVYYSFPYPAGSDHASKSTRSHSIDLLKQEARHF
ncbi:nucleic acid/nucleotide deaminase domain-containing protein [Pyxidicoccus trucidator]|uniref:nucleic acid/nucleotide deaminase domain-containing protein n=1 Tax=Pyxidicoccus trucidator TaxID=2709662 RepID=UPI0013DAB83E|nr:nucleic acid/nucleotide deaminase domain-containing protein [Pyxidicoccus trucidator]